MFTNTRPPAPSMTEKNNNTPATPLLNNTGMSTGDQIAIAAMFCGCCTFFGGTAGAVGNLLVTGTGVNLGKSIAIGAGIGSGVAGIGLTYPKLKESCTEANAESPVPSSPQL